MAWQEAIESQTDFGRGYLLWSRARSVPDGDLRAAEWLIRAEADSAEDPALVSAIHECARTHRATDPDIWDQHWTQTTQAAPPAWLTLDLQLLALARGWITTDTYEDEFTYLLDHPALLEPSSDVAVSPNPHPSPPSPTPSSPGNNPAGPPTSRSHTWQPTNPTETADQPRSPVRHPRPELPNKGTADSRRNHAPMVR